MTILRKEFIDEYDRLEELLIKNLPYEIKGSNEKHTANAFKHRTKSALQRCDFIHFNSKERISFMIFDVDKVGDQTAIEAYPTINDFWNYMNEKVGLEPTFITQTSKGYHFAFHFKNHIFTHQTKPLNYLNAIKESMIELLGCDIKGSSRNYGIWRNPLRHNHYFSDSYNYELNDFKDLIVPKKSIQKKFDRDVTLRQVSSGLLYDGNRNNAIFYAAMKWAKNRKELKVEDIFFYAVSVNHKCDIPLDQKEVMAISSSVYKYYSSDSIFILSDTQNVRDMNIGVMNFKKIKDLSKEEYDLEVKRRQSLSAQRTNQMLKDKQANITKARKVFQETCLSKNRLKVQSTIKKLASEGEKINISKIARMTDLDRKTVRKYYKAFKVV